MQNFDITLKNEKENSYRFIILLFVILHVLFFTYMSFDQQLWKFGIAGLVITFLYSGYRWLITNTGKQRFSYGSGYFFLISIVLIMDHWWLSAIDGLLYIFSTVALTPITFSFSKSKIAKQVFPRKKYPWDELSNVVLKDNILTLDFKNNQLLQSEIASTNINQEAFNIFAQQQLNK